MRDSIPKVGDAVRSKAGRDAGRVFIVTAVEGQYVWLCDGDLRKLEAPKKKKLRHISPLPTGTGMDSAADGEKVCNAQIARHIKGLCEKDTTQTNKEE
ncbi:MAG TPA: KOW domain-containing RNA-binding protein [Eubacteriales bacterium]|nr:KOW domain-containing RNA-binding protein [Clostridia bacterium]HRV73428.1 KOW domain-containing RNA-binding protein [Eubacteriales bacterium]